MNKTYNIYFKDLTETAQKEILDFYELQNAEDANWEITPLAVMEYETDPDAVKEELEIQEQEKASGWLIKAINDLVYEQRKLLNGIDKLREKEMTPEQAEKLDELEKKLL